MQRLKWIGIAAVVCAAIATLHPAESRATLKSRVDAQVSPYIEAMVVDGLVVGIVDKGEVHVFGYGKGGAGGVPDGNTVYEIGSVSKVFTGILLADAVAQGRVRLDQPLQELMPDGVTVPQKGTAGQVYT